MTKRGIGVNALAQSSGICPSTIYHFLHGTREMHLDDLRALGGVLQVSPSWIAWGQ